MGVVADVKLNEYDKIEWRDVAHILRQDWTEAEFEKAWKEFVALKRRKELQ